ncbi:hypothetical protein EMCRGX_G029579 [Ephydatia muelleri]|eukprot:Em0013g179a
MVNFNWFRRRQRQQQLQWQDPNVPRRERHILSIVSSVISCTVLIVSLALKEWATASADNCSYVFALTSVVRSDLPTLGLADYYTTAQQILVSCILSISVLTILSSLVAVFISAGYPRERVDFLRHYAVFNIVSLLCIVLVAGLWLAVVETLPANINDKDGCLILHPDPVVHFGYAYYIFLASGVFSLTAAAFNLLCGRSLADRRRQMRLWLSRQQQTSRAPRYQPVSNESPPAYTLIDTSDFTSSEPESAPSDTDTRSSGLEQNTVRRQPPSNPIQPPPYAP